MATSHGGPDDEALMLLFRDTGDERAFETLYSRYIERMASYIGRYVDGPEAARDLAQETFIRIAGSRRSYEVRARFSTWAYRIATNLAINAYKASRRRGCISLNSPEGPSWSAVDADEPIDAIIAEETAAEIQEAIEGLPSAQRDAFRVVVVEGMSYVRAAVRLKCTVGTVKSRVHHARKSIRKTVEGEVAE